MTKKLSAEPRASSVSNIFAPVTPSNPAWERLPADLRQSFDDFNEQTASGSALMRLAHPVRCPAAEPNFLPLLEKHLLPKAAWDELARRWRDQTEVTAEVLGSLVNRPGFEKLRGLVDAGARLPGGTEVGNVYANMLMVRHFVSPQPYFRIDDSLCSMLLATELDDDLPLSVLKPPYPRFFVEFGTRRDLPLHVFNEISGEHVLEGAYIETGMRSADGQQGLYVMLTGSPLGKRNALDDATHAIYMPLGDGMSLKEAVEYSFREGSRMASKTGLRPADEKTLEPALACLNFLAKVMLYITLPEARKELHAERSDWLRQHANLKSPAKKTKAERRGRLLTDYILVQPSTQSQDVARQLDSEGRSPKAHWRRGHLREQAYGEKLSLRKMVFINPTLVNASKLGETIPAPQYKVR